MRIEYEIISLSKDPFNPELNFKVAVKYEEMGQTASAVTFYLRTAEYGYSTHIDLAYASLLRMAACFAQQNDRAHTVINCWRQAIIVNPRRPEAYFIMAQYHEHKSEWQETYTWATMGLAQEDINPLPVYVGYPGRFGLEFEKAVSAWWIGRKDECESLFDHLLTTYKMAPDYVNSCMSNYKMIKDRNAS